MSRVMPIQARSLVNPVKQPDTWFGLRYNMNLYRGCQHRCIYCDSRSQCYQITDFDHEVLYKENAIAQLNDELDRKRIKGTIGTGSMNDPYMPIEKELQLTRQAMQVIADHRFPVHILTKSDLVLRDMDILQQIKEQFALVSFTITAAEDALSNVIEPGASPSSKRFEAMHILAKNGIQSGVLLMPILPYITDSRKNIEPLLRKAVDHGAAYVLPSLGVSMRDRQRLYFYQKLDQHFPGLRSKYERKFGDQMYCPANHIWQLEEWLNELCNKLDLPTKIPFYQPQMDKQLAFF
ncbi:MAG: radical SAM protein [Anaerolineaceae bacterium]|nr:radical SAM protein [Anaerolineaceae bacterium]